MTANPLHLYRALLRESSYLPLPSCRSYIKAYITLSFRRHLPKYKKPLQTTSGNDISLPRQLQLLHRARKFYSALKRANQGYPTPLEKVLRMTYGRAGRRRHELLHKFTIAPARTGELSKPNDNASKVQKFSAEWSPPSRWTALLNSQMAQQGFFPRSGATHRLRRFNPPKITIWGRPLPKSRYKNLRRKWFLWNTEAMVPPLPEPEYNELHNLVSGKTKIPPFIPRRPRAQMGPEVSQSEEADDQSSMLLQGPKPVPTPHAYNFEHRHKITPRLIRRMLSRVVLQRAPLAMAAERSKRGVVFRWDDGRPREFLEQSRVPAPTSQRMSDLLFG